MKNDRCIGCFPKLQFLGKLFRFFDEMVTFCKLLKHDILTFFFKLLEIIRLKV